MSDAPTVEAKTVPWMQLTDEPAAAYARFLVYLHLGRTRSVDAAYVTEQATAANRGKSRQSSRRKTGKTDRASGQWFSDSAKYHWVERALAYDIDCLTGRGYETVIDFINTLAILANKALNVAAQEKVRPRNMRDILALVNILGSFIPAETVAAIQDDAERRRISAIGNVGNVGAEKPGGDRV